jgi:long-chain acyl-CoA synthetase
VIVLRTRVGGGDAAALRDALVAHCRTRLAGYKCPRGISFVDALPLSAAGKVLKARLRELHRGS